MAKQLISENGTAILENFINTENGMRLYKLYPTKQAAQNEPPLGTQVVEYRSKWIIVTYVNLGVAVGTLLTYFGGKI